MKNTYLLLALGILLIASGSVNLLLDVDNKVHYFSNGLLSGIGISILYVQIRKLMKPRS